MVAYKYPFVFDSKLHKPFSKASRHLVHNAHRSFPSLNLSREQEALLRLGLCAFDMDYRWVGNLTDSVANAKQSEVVVRLYRSWTGNLVYEARYRPGSTRTLLLYEFAYETDEKVYNGQQTAAEEAKSYQDILEGGILDVIMSQIKVSQAEEQR